MFWARISPSTAFHDLFDMLQLFVQARTLLGRNA